MKLLKVLLVLFHFCLIVGFSFQSDAQPHPPGGYPFISEIMYNPPEAGLDSLEFIEVSPDFLSGSVGPGWFFSAGIDFIFPVGWDYNQVVVVAKDSVAFENAFGLPALQWTNSFLLNSGEYLVLNAPDGEVIDSVFYGVTAPWPEEANGFGHSIEICSIDFTLDGNNPENWAASQNNTGVEVNGSVIYASPGVHTGNCTIVKVSEIENSESFQVYPNPSSGIFSLRFSKLLSKAILRIYDSKGATAYEKELPAGSTKLECQFDLLSGIYLVKLESKDESFKTRLVITE